ncbi:ImmA/IrrE family metallo-endopeptidase [Nocardioides sp. HDW12B]|uniref:ImmA/IrrE family metallo-endopeptidase n=1 Tax=Nocardioides sp. HDW12B TaxID=2714939 RepID=UPI00140C3B41|nr:ImmA/IrrE family metallo-endopeptidase [Nocardioides sp. HDW12B]QIK66836.1 ImmA/IrrE family metallo-endopeptidase [Nocardioides sp. HDW12B]
MSGLEPNAVPLRTDPMSLSAPKPQGLERWMDRRGSGPNRPPPTRWRDQVPQLLKRLLPDYDAQIDPIDLNSIARQLGAADIRYRAERMHGFTDWSARRPVIFLAFSRSDGRRRFTLGHEIGHIITSAHLDPHEDADSALLEAFARKPEIVCDVIAAELLLPRAYLAELAIPCRSLDEMRAASNQLRVSQSMLVTRLMAVDVPRVLLRMRRSASGQWIAVSRAGTKRDWKSDLDLEPKTQAALDQLGYRTTQLQVSVRRRGGITVHLAEARRSGQSEVLLYLDVEDGPVPQFDLHLAQPPDTARF